MAENVLYRTEVVNSFGIEGLVKTIDNDDLTITTSSPISETPGTNPEQLLAASLATCLNATIEAEEKRRKLSHQSVVRVVVEMLRDNEGFQFNVQANVLIPHVSHVEAQDILEIAQRRCPVDKLLSGNNNFKVTLVKQFD